MSRRAGARALILAVCALSMGLGIAACGGTEPSTTTASERTEEAAQATKCNFATNVLTMFDASTNGTALPSNNIGIGCTDPRKISAYKSLFH